MKVRALRGFKDLSEGVRHARGDEFDVTAERLKELQATTFGQLVECVDPKPAKKQKKQKKQKPETPEDKAKKPETPEDDQDSETPEDAAVKPETAAE